MVEHLGDGAGRELGRRCQLAGGQLTALEQLEQELELGVAELGAAEMRVAAAQAAERPKEPAEGQAELGQLLGAPL
jgi:hypothetical protein